MAVPIADNETDKPEPADKHIAQQCPVAMHLVALPTRIRCHDRLDTSGNGRLIGRREYVAQIGLARQVVAAVPATIRAAIAEKVLGCSDDMTTTQEIRCAGHTLQPF